MADELKQRIRIVKHVPSTIDYTPADVLEVEVEVPAGVSLNERFDRLNDDTDRMLQRWKSPFQDRKTATSGSEPSVVEEAPASLNPEGLPWKKNHYGEWVFANISGAEPLVELLKKDKTVTIGDYTHSLSGATKQFINRKKVAQKETEKRGG